MNILTIAVHPDDETLGCGGTLLNYAAQGAALHWLLVTAAHAPEFTPEQIEQQAQQVRAVEQAYPFAALHWLELPSIRLETLPLNQIVVALRQVIEQVRPEVVFVPNRSDVHSDHRVVFQASLAVLKAFYMRSLGVRRVLACDTISETEAAPPLPENAFVPTTFVDVSATFERKLEIMHLYQTEVHPDPFPRAPGAIRAQARYRGATVGVEYAEAFMLIREVL
jgi:LmbE family N-acetylglucosaminyl deacetylase